MQRDTIRSDAMLKNFSENNLMKSGFESTLSGPFGAPFSIPSESILRPILSPVRDPFWIPENDLKMGRAPAVGHGSR